MAIIAKNYYGTAQPRCPHFMECGGCLFQDITYENQLNIKKEYINKLFENFYTIDTVYPSHSEGYFYRNRMDFVCAFGSRGLRRRSSFRNVVNITECHIMQAKSQSLWAKIIPDIFDIDDYDYLKHIGFLRYVVLRQGYFSEQNMCTFVVADKNNLELMSKTAKIADSIGDICNSIVFLENNGKADTSFGDYIDTGRNNYIIEELSGIKYKIFPNSFFQSNSYIAEKMYDSIKKEVYGNVLDLCSGIGSISLYIADKCDNVTGVELMDESVYSANENLKINENIQNVSFVKSDIKDYLSANTGKFSVVVADPPRAGINPKALKDLVDLSVDKIVYMSCNPVSLRENIEGMKDQYEITSLEAYDMFPQTPHVEMIAVLKRK